MPFDGSTELSALLAPQITTVLELEQAAGEPLVSGIFCLTLVSFFASLSLCVATLGVARGWHGGTVQSAGFVYPGVRCQIAFADASFQLVVALASLGLTSARSPSDMLVCGPAARLPNWFFHNDWFTFQIIMASFCWPLTYLIAVSLSMTLDACGSRETVFHLASIKSTKRRWKFLGFLLSIYLMIRLLAGAGLHRVGMTTFSGGCFVLQHDFLSTWRMGGVDNGFSRFLLAHSIVSATGVLVMLLLIADNRRAFFAAPHHILRGLRECRSACARARRPEAPYIVSDGERGEPSAFPAAGPEIYHATPAAAAATTTTTTATAATTVNPTLHAVSGPPQNQTVC